MSKLDGTNRVGCCTRCDKKIYEVHHQYAVDHPYAGDATKVGKPLSDLRKVTLLLINGHQLVITMCINCLTESETPRWSHIWKKLLKTWELEHDDEHRKLMGLSPLTSRSKRIQTEWFEKMVFNIPIGVLAITGGDDNG